jgi:2-polyprenyl-6-methoxyphenol hydroxylase-like FAD-dependent oxidoreductase
MTENFDIVIVGGGIAGSSLAYSMSKAGLRVLVLESETEFRDRVRGEILAPWGFAEAQALGLSSALQQAGARQLPWLNQYLGPQQIERRDLTATTLTKTPLVTFYHPRMQTSLLQAAESAGAQVRRGIVVTNISPGKPPRVTHKSANQMETITARLVVVADGRNSPFRRQAGFQVQRETQSLCLAGVLMESVPIPVDTFHMFTNPALGEITVWAPEGDGRVRTYLGYWGETRPRLQGDADVARLFEALRWTGIVGDYFSNAKQAGPLASFDGADNWVEHPYMDGVALLGDSAASSDPTWGQGLALSLRSTRTLRDALLRNDDWDCAGHEYALAHDDLCGKVRTVSGWFREFFMVTGPAAEVRRAHAFPLIAQDPARVPDLLFSGPDIPIASDARARFFGEDVAAASV